MKIQREKAVIRRYHYDIRDHTEKDSDSKTLVNVDFQLIERKETLTSLLLTVSFHLVFEEFVIYGEITQVNQLLDRSIEDTSQLSQEEMRELAAVALDILNRMTYEVTEIALDLPGIQLEF